MSDSQDAFNPLLKALLFGFTSIGSMYLTKVCYEEKGKHDEEIQKVKRAFHKIEEYEPDELVEKLEGLYKKEKGSGKYIDCGKFFVKGVISCENPVTSFKDSNIKLVYANLKKYDLVATVNEKKVLDHSRQYNSSKHNYAGIFELKPTLGSSKKGAKCFVENIRQSTLGNVTQFIASQETSLMPAINVAALGVGSIIKIGFDQNEYGIKVGDKITVYGKVLFDKVNQLIKFENPSNILVNKEEYERYISEFSGAALGVFLFAILTGVQVYLFADAVSSLVSSKSKKSHKK